MRGRWDSPHLTSPVLFESGGRHETMHTLAPSQPSEASQLISHEESQALSRVAAMAAYHLLSRRVSGTWTTSIRLIISQKPATTENMARYLMSSSFSRLGYARLYPTILSCPSLQAHYSLYDANSFRILPLQGSGTNNGYTAYS
jgi:hypothetical protein